MMMTKMKNLPFTIVDLEQGSQAWKEFKVSKLGSTDAADLMGIKTPWKQETLLQKWERFTSFSEKDVFVTHKMQEGVRREPLIREEMNKKLGIQHKPAVVQSLDHPSIIASLDGFFVGSQGEDLFVCLLEIKVSSHNSCLDASLGKIPPYYNAQMQHQMMVTGADHVVYAVEHGNTINHCRCERDEAFIEELRKRCFSFLDAVANLEAPKPTAEDWADYSGDHLYSENARELREILLKQKELEEKAEELRAQIIEKALHPRIKAGGLSIQSIEKKGVVNYRKIIADYNVDQEKYRGANTSYWKISL